MLFGLGLKESSLKEGWMWEGKGTNVCSCQVTYTHTCSVYDTWNILLLKIIVWYEYNYSHFKNEKKKTHIYQVPFKYLPIGTVTIEKLTLSQWFSSDNTLHPFYFVVILGFPCGASGKEFICQCRRHRDGGFIPGSRRPPGVGNGNPLQYSCLENPMDRGAWQVTVHGVAKSQTQLSTHTRTCARTHTHTHSAQG